MDEPADCSLQDAAVALGVSPSVLGRLLQSGQLPAHLGPDGRWSRVLLADLDTHRDDRFALRQRMVQEIRARRWAEPDPVDELAG